MKTAAEQEKNFRRDFNALLKKYDAEIEITDDDKPYGMHRGIAIITILGKYDYKKGEKINEFCEFNL